VDVKPAKLYVGVGQFDLDSGIAEIMQPAYFGQPNQLRPAAPTQAVSSFIGYPMDMGAGVAPAPSWNRSTGLWVQAPQVPSTRVRPNASAASWEAGFMPEARGPILMKFGKMMHLSPVSQQNVRTFEIQDGGSRSLEK